MIVEMMNCRPARSVLLCSAWRVTIRSNKEIGVKGLIPVWLPGGVFLPTYGWDIEIVQRIYKETVVKRPAIQAIQASGLQYRQGETTATQVLINEGL